MLKYCVEKWDKNKDKLEQALRDDIKLSKRSYHDLLVATIQNIFHDGDDIKWNTERITQIDDGDYQGTLLFVIPMDTSEPCASEYLITYVSYGSCSGCDTLLALQDDVKLSMHDKREDLYERCIKDYMTLCRDLVCRMKHPYSSYWTCDERFVEIKWRYEDDED